MKTVRANKNRIVVGVDFSPAGDEAIREAMRLAKQLPNSELHVTSVIETHGNLHDKKKLEHVSNALRSGMDELHNQVMRVCSPESDGDTFTQEVVFHVRLGEPASILIQVAADVDADLIVVGTHRRHGVERLLLGSVTEALVRNAPLPVLVAYPKGLAALPKTPQMDPAQSGDDFHEEALSVQRHIEFVPHTPHISGLL